jgi:rod shape-determining protein MreD
MVLVMAGILLQLSWLPALRPLGVVPDLALVLVVLVGLEGTASQALLVAVAGGLLMDLASSAGFGLWTGVLVVVALVTGLLQRAGVELESMMWSLALVAAGTLVANVVILVGIADSVARWQWGTVAWRLVVQLGLNLVLVVCLRPLVRWLERDSGVWSGDLGRG